MLGRRIECCGSGHTGGKYELSEDEVPQFLELWYLLEENYQKHYKGLLDSVSQFKNAAAAPNPGNLEPAMLAMASFDVISRHGGPVPAYRTQLLAEGLRQHIPKSPLWQLAREWERAATELNAAAKRLRETVADGVKKSVGTALPPAAIDQWVESLYFAVRQTAKGKDLSDEMYSTEQNVDGRLSLSWQGWTLATGLPATVKVDDLEALHDKLVGELTSAESTMRMKRALEAWTTARNRIWREAEVLELRGMLPGVCDLCPGGEGSRKRKSNKRKQAAG